MSNDARPLWRKLAGHYLREQRIDQGRILTEVAATAGVSPQYLSELERGRKEPSSEVLAAAARALGLSLADLLGLAQGELARLARPRPAKAPAPVAPRHDLGSGSAGPAGHDRDVAPADAAPPAQTILPAETVPASGTVPTAQALGTGCAARVTSQPRMSLAA